MNNLTHVLETIGLSEKEAKVYLTCLKFPNQATSIIAKKNAMNRGTTFVILHELLKKGLVKKSITSNVQRFSAVNPEEIVTYLEKKELTLQEHKKTITSLLPEFKSQQGEEGGKPIFQFYEGKDGLQNLVSEILVDDHTHIKTILSPEPFIHLLGNEFYKDWDIRRQKKKKHMQVLLAYNDFQNPFFTTHNASLRITRYLPEPLHFPMTTFLFQDTVILLSHKDNFGLSIQSSEYKNMQEVFFDTHWAISKSHINEDEFRMPLI